jgi:Tol biopolymer transport system component
MRIDPAGGAPVPICDIPTGSGFAASWGATGQILFASVQGDAIFRVPAAGGTPEKVLASDVSRQEFRVAWPTYLPDGRGFLYQLRGADKKLTLMLADGDRPPREVAPIASRVEFVAPNWLLFARDGALFAQKFDRAAGKLVGSAVAVAPAVRYFFSSAWAGFAASPNGSIVYMSAQTSSRLLWFDRAGAPRGGIDGSGNHLHVAISPDGRSALSDRTVPELGTYDLWRLDLVRGIETRLTTAPDADFDGLWLPDGKSIVYSTIFTRAPIVVRRDLESGKEEPLLPRETFQSATDVTRDGRQLAFIERGASGKFHAMTLQLEGERSPRDLFSPDAGEADVRFSPDSRYVAYISDFSGSNEAYIAPLAAPAASVRISPNGASRLRWSRDGREILFLDSDNAMVSIPVRTSPNLEIGSPTTLFRLPERATWVDFDVTPDGQRFLAVVRERTAGLAPVSVVVGWSPPASP